MLSWVTVPCPYLIKDHYFLRSTWFLESFLGRPDSYLFLARSPRCFASSTVQGLVLSGGAALEASPVPVFIFLCLAAPVAEPHLVSWSRPGMSC